MKKETTKHKRPKIQLSDIKKVFTLNIGTVLFGTLFLYMIISILLYLTSVRTISYQVTAGPLSRNQTYTALALYSEEVVDAKTSGYVTYYARDNSKTRKFGPVFGISDTRETPENIDLKEGDLSALRSSMAKFAYGFQPDSFTEAYEFKYELEGDILQYAGVKPITQNVDTSKVEDGANGASPNTIQPQTVNNQTINFAANEGIILYSADGYEGISEAALTKEDFVQKAKLKKNLRTAEKVNLGDPVYKIINSEEWSIYIPLTEKQTVQIAGRDKIRVKFLKDGETQVGDFTIIQKDKDFYCKITFNNGLIRYASNRFLEIELVTNTKSGLKVPLSSLVNKDFYVIPKEFVIDTKVNSEAKFIKETTDKSGKTIQEFVDATLYAEQEEQYYVDMAEFKEGDVLIKPDSTERYIIKDKAPLEGVYSTNKGYAVFRKVVIIDQNEDFCIVEQGTTFGIAQYDNIVLKSNTVKEEEILN